MLGTKIENLKILNDKGFLVPEFVVVSFEEFGCPMEELENIMKKATKENLSEISRQLKHVLLANCRSDLKVSVPWEISAVRSSANLEDGEESSFAGQFDTFLEVPKDEVLDKILACLCSLYNENVLYYVLHHNLKISDLRMNVIVQKMIPSEYSGVCFTANPQGILNESVIIAGKGIGENVVTDRVDVTSYYYNLTDRLYYYEGKEEYLPADMVHEIIKISEEMKTFLGEYLDIEFAIYEEQIYILQARKITTLSDENALILDNSNIVESYPGLSLPLTCSFVNGVYGGIFKSLSRRVLKNEKVLDKHDAVFSNMVGSVNGRIYYKISNWYTVIKFLPMNKKIIPIWQEMMGVKNKSYDKDDLKLPFFVRVGTYFNVISEMLHVSKNMDKLSEKFRVINKDFYSAYRNDMSLQELSELYQKLQKELLACWDITLLNDVYSFLFTGLLKNKLKKKYDNAEELTNQFISGISNIESLKPIKEMVRLAYEKDKMSEQEYKDALINYIKCYGDRNLEELKLESETFRSNPELLERRIAQYREDVNKLEEVYSNLNSEKETALTELDKVSGFFAKKAAKGISNREISRLNRSRIFGMVRLLFLSFGENFFKDNLIDDVRDVFWLTVEEVFSLIETKKPMQEVIADRKSKYEMYQYLPAYSRLIFEEKEFDKNHRRINANKVSYDENKLMGIPCSNGVVTGEALVVNDVTKVKGEKDKILITKMTDPGWVFLLATAKGVISEKGSLLSHTAIISRELKIPSIVGVEHLMDTVQNGDIVRMDGNLGTVEIIQRTEEK